MDINKLYFVKCWINSPSELQPFHDYYGKEVVAVYESVSDEFNGKEPLFSFSSDSSTTFQIPSQYLVKGNKPKRRNKPTYLTDKKNSKTKCKRCGSYLSGNGWGYFECCNCGEEIYWGSDY